MNLDGGQQRSWMKSFQAEKITSVKELERKRKNTAAAE